MAYGSILKTADDSSAARKGRGAFFTPPEMAEYLANWAIRSSEESVLEPACGEAVFLIEAYKRLRSLGAEAEDASKRIVGCELHKESADAALARCSRYSFRPAIEVGDFFKKQPSEKYDAIIGNPPYVRFQVLDSDQKDSFKEVSQRTGYAISALASAWAPFVMHATSFLNEGGRIAFVLPAELLTVNYASAIRSFLIAEFPDITIVTFDRQVFPEVQEEVVLLLANGYHRGSAGFIKWRQASDLNRISESVDRDYYPSANGDRWTPGFVSELVSSTLAGLEGNGFCRLDDWGKLALGAVTGNNKFFTLSTDEVKIIGLDQDEVLRVSPPGSKHLRGFELSDADFLKLAAQGKKSFLFYPGDKPTDAARRYIEFGLDKGIDQGYKCRKRKPWWRVPLTNIPDAFVTYMNDYAPNICANSARLHCLNSVHGLTFSDEHQDIDPRLFALSCINSITLLSAEIEGRAYGGGLLKVEPREAAKLQVPSPQLVRSMRDQLEKILSDSRIDSGGKDLIATRNRIDAIMVERLDKLEPTVLEQIRNSKDILYTRRKNRGRKR